MIVHFFIEITKDQRQVDLEQAINKAGFPFYDATNVCPPEVTTLEEIEAILENK